MQKIIPERLQKGDKIMVIAPARGVKIIGKDVREICLLYTSPSPRDYAASRMPSSA